MKAKALTTLVTLAAASSLAFGGGDRLNQPVRWAQETRGTAETEALKVRALLDKPMLVREGGEQKVVVKIEIIGGEPAEKQAERPPLNLAVVLDRSGSMSGAKLEKARQAAMMLVDQLGADDVLSVVIYDTDVKVLEPARQVGSRQEKIKKAISKIQPGGSTALYAGVETGGKQLSEYLSENAINRVILLSDGLANIGPSSNSEIAKLGHELADDGMSVTTIGVGDDYNENLMTALAEASDANYYFVDDVEMLAEVFENELGELKSVVARRVIVEVKFPEGVRPLKFLGREDVIEKNRGRVKFGMLAGQQQREILLRCAVDPKAGNDLDLANITVTFEDADAQSSQSLEIDAVAVLTDDEKKAEANRDLAVHAEAEVYANADVSRRALELADSGDVAGAKSALFSQIGHLQVQHDMAPMAQQQALKHEIEVLERAQEDLERAGELSKGERKALQWNIYNRENSKSLQMQK